MQSYSMVSTALSRWHNCFVCQLLWWHWKASNRECSRLVVPSVDSAVLESAGCRHVVEQIDISMPPAKLNALLPLSVSSGSSLDWYSS